MERFDLVGIGSYAFRNAIRSKENPMDAIDFLKMVDNLGLKRALLCENLNYIEKGDEYIHTLANLASQYDITIEVGMRVATKNNLIRHIEVAKILNTKLIRLVLGEMGHNTLLNTEDRTCLKEQALGAIKKVLPLLEEANIYLGIENHFDLKAVELLDLVQRINSKRVGLIFDSTNCLGLIEEPVKVLHLMEGYVFSVHLKDYICEKIDGGYIFSGVDLGKGHLAVSDVIQRAYLSNPCVSFIVEYNMHPTIEMSEEELLAWELERARKNVALTLAAVSHNVTA